MSLILDALKRAEQERNVQEKIPSELTSVRQSKPNRLPVRRWLIEALVIILAAGLYFFIQFNNNNSPTTTKDQLSDNINSDTPSNKQSNVLVSNTKPVTLTQSESTLAVNRLYQKQAQKKAREKQNPTKSRSNSSNNKRVEPDPKILATAKPTTSNVEHIDPQLAIFLNMPLLAQMPLRFRQLIPSIEYSVHVYSQKEGAGLVELNGKRRRIGDEIAPGLIIIMILKDSIVLDYNGTQFRLMSLESWVNFG